MDMIATTFDMRAPFEGWRLRSGDRTVTTKEVQWSATSAERRTFERDFQAERRAGLVRGFPNIAVLPDRPPNTHSTDPSRVNWRSTPCQLGRVVPCRGLG